MVVFRIDLRKGDTIDGKYRVLRRIGSGSYGDVYLVEHVNRHYALKVLRLFDEISDLHEELVKRFRQEYETAQMPGNYFVHSMEYSELKGNPFFTMEYCANGDLTEYVGKHINMLPQLAFEVLLGLHDLHSNGKIHRDLKPENVLIRDNGHAALTDFGVVGNKEAKKRMTNKTIFNRPKQRFGSPLYMAPEMNELKGGGVTYLPTIDIWSFGVMMYEMLTSGQFPFGDPRNISDLADYQANAKKGIWNRQAIRECENGRRWLSVISRCLEADYQRRYQDVRDMIHYIGPMVPPYTPTTTTGTPRSQEAKRMIVTQGAITGTAYDLYQFIAGRGHMVRVGRSITNDIVLYGYEGSYLSRHHFTLEFSADKSRWKVRDGQWNKGERRWETSTNGTYLNSSPVTQDGLYLCCGDIITAGEYKLKIE